MEARGGHLLIYEKLISSGSSHIARVVRIIWQSEHAQLFRFLKFNLRAIKALSIKRIIDVFICIRKFSLGSIWFRSRQLWFGNRKLRFCNIKRWPTENYSANCCDIGIILDQRLYLLQLKCGIWIDAIELCVDASGRLRICLAVVACRTQS